MNNLSNFVIIFFALSSLILAIIAVLLTKTLSMSKKKRVYNKKIFTLESGMACISIVVCICLHNIISLSKLNNTTLLNAVRNSSVFSILDKSILGISRSTWSSIFEYYQYLELVSSSNIDVKQNFAYFSRIPLNLNKLTSYNNLQSALDYYMIVEKIVPNWIPDGYELLVCQAGRMDDCIVFISCYQKYDKNNGDYKKIMIQAINEEKSKITEDELPEDSIVYRLNGIDHYLILGDDKNRAIWSNESNICCITGEVSKDELKQMIDSIYY